MSNHPPIDSSAEKTEGVYALIEAIKKHGTVQVYNYRSEDRCFMAGFRYTLGGCFAGACVLAGSQAITFLIGFIKGLFL